MSFSENLQFLRTRQGQTQEQLAELLGVSRQSVSKWESSLSFPELETILRLCDLYGVTMDTLLRGDVQASLVEDTTRYNDAYDRFTRCVTASVGGILLGVSLMLLLNGLGIQEPTSGICFMVLLTVCVIVLVASGIEWEHFCKRHPCIEDFYTEEEKEAFHRRFIWYIAGGIGAILLGVILLMAMSAFLPEEEPFESYSAAMLLFIIAFGVMSLVYGGMQEEKYDIQKYNRDNDPAPEAKKRLNLIGAIQGTLMLLTTSVYLFLGFSKGGWGRYPWLFAIGGIGCAIVAVLLDPYKGEER